MTTTHVRFWSKFKNLMCSKIDGVNMSMNEKQINALRGCKLELLSDVKVNNL